MKEAFERELLYIQVAETYAQKHQLTPQEVHHQFCHHAVFKKLCAPSGTQAPLTFEKRFQRLKRDS